MGGGAELSPARRLEIGLTRSLKREEVDRLVHGLIIHSDGMGTQRFKARLAVSATQASDDLVSSLLQPVRIERPVG